MAQLDLMSNGRKMRSEVGLRIYMAGQVYGLELTKDTMEELYYTISYQDNNLENMF